MILRLRIMIGLVLALPVALLLWLLLMSTQQPRTRQRLPDGSGLELVLVSFSTNISYRSPRLSPVQQTVRSVLPRWLAHRLGLFQAVGAITMGSRLGETNLAVFTACGEVPPNSFSGAKLEVAEENGT